MTGKRFELIPNLQGQVDIIDHVESEEKNAICINKMRDYEHREVLQ